MIKIKKKGIFLPLILIVSFMMLFSSTISVFATGQNGTTLTNSSVTATPTWERVFDWDINKTVTPEVWNLFQGDSGTSQYTIDVSKGIGSDHKNITGTVSVTNGGEVATEGLAILVRLINPSDSVTYASQVVDVSSNPVLDPGETGNYNYTIYYSDSVSDNNFKVKTDITCTNHSGHLGVPFGPSPSSDGFQFPTVPTLIFDSINVEDTNGGNWMFNASGSTSYNETFTYANEGINQNTATIMETGQSSSASVTVNTYALDVSKTASTSFTRGYNWTINKTGDQPALTLALNQTFPINYQVEVDATYVDSNWRATGTITIHNPSPMSAVINNISDIISTDIAATTSFGVTFPYTLAGGATLTGTYIADLPDAASRINTATAVLQNHAYDPDLNSTPTGTTNFIGTADVSFDNGILNVTDESVAIVDSIVGNLGSLSYNDVLPKTYTYSIVAGPYTSSGDYTINNTASFTTNDTGATGSSSWSVIIHVPSQGATLTIGYWKNHAGLGPQKDMVTQYLPICLGTPSGDKRIEVLSADQAVKYLRMNGDASNGINKLYAQLLAAKLNIANGADGTVIEPTITAADAFLSAHNNTSWSSLSKAVKTKLLGWAAKLDSYNNGNMGVPHASE